MRRIEAAGVVVVGLLCLVLAGCMGGVNPPKYTVEGVVDGATYENTVTPAVTEHGTTRVELMLNGETFESGTVIDTPGRYTLEIVATNSGESVSEEISFTVLKTHTFGIFEDLQGFSIGWVDNWPVYNSDERFIVPGGQPGSVKVIRDEREESTRLWVVGSGAADSQYLSPHPDWLNDWSPYTTLAFWLYFEDLGELQESMAVWIKVSDTIVGFDKSDLKAGWNHLEVDLEELMIDDLSNQTSIIQIVVCSAQVYYVDEIKLIQKLD